MLPQDSRAEIWESLCKEIQTPPFQRKFNHFKKTHPKLARFNTSQDLVSYFHAQDTSAIANKEQLLHLLVSNYRIKPERKGWLMTLLLVVLWKQMEYTFIRFGFSALNRINPFDPFAPVYESYIEAFLAKRKRSPDDFGKVSQNTPNKIALHLKDRAEYLIRQELKECGRFRGEPESDIPAPEYLPWQYEVERMMEEWMMNGILRPRESDLVIKHLVYEYTFEELAKQQETSSATLRQRFHRALLHLKPYLWKKFLSRNRG